MFHAMNRARVGRMLFESPAAYDGFVDAITEALRLEPIRVLAYCLMVNHWHLVLWPHTVAQMSAFIGWLAMTHAKRLQQFRGQVGSGPIYRSRFKAVPVSTEIGAVRVIRYVERNPVRSGNVERPELWPWSSAGQRVGRIVLADWPVPKPVNWLHYLNDEESPSELAEIRVALTASRKPGRPQKTTPGLFSGPGLYSEDS